MRETMWSAKIVNQMKKCNALVLNIHGHDMQAPGWPDTFVSHTVFNGFIEFKGKATKLKGIQKSIIDKLNEKGTPAVVVRYPNLIQTTNGRLLSYFDGTGRGLLASLAKIGTQRGDT